MSKYVMLKSTVEQTMFSADLLREFSGVNSYACVVEHHDEGRFNGLLAEIMIQDALGLERASVGFDDGSDFEFAGVRYDVKCNTNNVLPFETLTFDVKESTLHNDVDAFLFVHYCKQNDFFYLVGWISKTDFLKLAVFHAKGSVKLASNIKYFYDTLSVKYSQLRCVYDLNKGVMTI